MTIADTGLTRGDWVVLDLVDGDGEPRDEYHGALARVVEPSPVMTAVRVEGGALLHLFTHEMSRACLVAPGGGLTARWRVRRVWVAHAIPVNPHAVVSAYAFDNPADALALATARARENVR